jgi:hypothetical protein
MKCVSSYHLLFPHSEGIVGKHLKPSYIYLFLPLHFIQCVKVIIHYDHQVSERTFVNVDHPPPPSCTWESLLLKEISGSNFSFEKEVGEIYFFLDLLISHEYLLQHYTTQS